eukprot:494537-Rhodomonas_salina.2
MREISSGESTGLTLAGTAWSVRRICVRRILYPRTGLAPFSFQLPPSAFSLKLSENLCNGDCTRARINGFAPHLFAGARESALISRRMRSCGSSTLARYALQYKVLAFYILAHRVLRTTVLRAPVLRATVLGTTVLRAGVRALSP